MNLTAEAVEKLVKECAGDTVEAAGIVHKFSFNKAKIEENKTKIRDLLADLPEPFHTSKGGGWSFLNGCQDREGNQWTGLHLTVEQLVCLGIAAGLARWLMQDMADILPGGVPYFSVDA